jgi:hypothetical protein
MVDHCSGTDAVATSSHSSQSALTSIECASGGEGGATNARFCPSRRGLAEDSASADKSKKTLEEAFTSLAGVRVHLNIRVQELTNADGNLSGERRSPTGTKLIPRDSCSLRFTLVDAAVSPGNSAEIRGNA